jgi:hypothetical protein
MITHGEDVIDVAELTSIECYQLCLRVFSSNMCPESSSVNEESVISLLEKLSSDIEHWRSPIDCTRMFFVIDRWLNGCQPPPRCRLIHEGVQCMEISEEKDSYCEQLHRCKSTLVKCGGLRGTYEDQFCSDHRCMSVTEDGKHCLLERFEDSEYCDVHTCIGCVQQGIRPIGCCSPLACPRHQCSLRLCNRPRIFPNLFCGDHCCLEVSF